MPLRGSDESGHAQSHAFMIVFPNGWNRTQVAEGFQ